jgi:hypothetical protein
MNRTATIILASVLALILAAGFIIRMRFEKARFDHTVHEALKTSEGYDQLFIDMVNRLEQELAKRASFGYPGGKDPMTGVKRQVVMEQPAKSPVHKMGERVEDPVRLTAIIGDAGNKKITAVVMDGERSYSVEPGDVVAGRRITKISPEGIFMENDSLYFFYDIFGKKGTRLKEVRPLTAPAAVR